MTSSAPRRIAALSLLFGSFLLLLMVFSLPAALAYEVDENLHKDAIDPAPVDSVTTGGALNEPTLDVVENSEQLDQAEELLKNNQAEDPSQLAQAHVGQDANLAQDGTVKETPALPGDGTSTYAMLAASNVAPFNPEENQGTGVKDIEGADDHGDGSGDDDGGPSQDGQPIQPAQLVQLYDEVEAREEPLAPKYTAVVQAQEAALAKVEQLQKLPADPAVAAPLTAAVQELNEAEATAAIWNAEAHAQDAQKVAITALLEAHDAGGDAAGKIEDLKQRRTDLEGDLAWAQSHNDTIAVTQLSQQLSRLDVTDQTTEAWRVQNAHDLVIPKVIADLEALLKAGQEAEIAAAKLLRRDAERDRAGVVPAEERLVGYQAPRDLMDESITALGDDLPANPGVNLPTAQALAERGEVPGWSEINVTVKADLGPAGFPAEGTQVVVHGHALENYAHGGYTEQRVTFKVPTGAGALITSADYTNPQGLTQQAGVAGRVVRTSANGPATVWTTVDYTPAPNSTAIDPARQPLFPVQSPPAQGEMPRWIEPKLAQELGQIEHRGTQVAARRATLVKTIQAQQATLQGWRTLNNQEPGAVDGAKIAGLEAQIKAGGTELRLLEDQLTAMDWQDYAAWAEGAARDWGGELDREIHTLRGQMERYQARGASDTQLSGYRDPTGPLQTAWRHYTVTVPKSVSQAADLRKAWLTVEEAAAKLTPGIIAEANAPAPPLPGQGSGTYDVASQAVAFGRHADAVGLYQAYVNALTAANDQAKAAELNQAVGEIMRQAQGSTAP